MTKLLKKIIIFAVLIGIVVSILNYKNIRKQILMKIYIRDYQEYVERYSEEFGVDPNLIYAIIKAESKFNEEAVSNKEAKGLMQIMYTTALDVAKTLNIEIDEKKLLEPECNIMIGTKYISILLNRYSNIELALAAYNAGSGNVDKWVEKSILLEDGSNVENIPYKETNNYVRKILRDYEIYKELYN